MANSGIYCITNLINKKKYIGCSRDIDKRIREHTNMLLNNSHHSKFLQHAWNKYGKENFSFTIITNDISDKDSLKLLEIYWICYYGTYFRDGNGYNMTYGGDGSFGGLTDEAKLKMKQTRKRRGCFWTGRTHSLDTKRKMSESQKGRVFSEASRKKMSESRKGEKCYIFGKHHTEETRAKISAANSGKNHWLFGKKMPDETKKKISKSVSGELNGMFGKTHSAETKEKMRNKTSKALDLNKANEIRILISSGMKQKDIAKIFSVSPTTICEINKEKTWKRLI